MAKEQCFVEVTIRWGVRWVGSHYEPTPGEGMYVQVMQAMTRDRITFRGCPAGEGGTVEAAIQDFVFRGCREWEGKQPLTREMVVVHKTKDYRKRNI